ncbi:MAG: hypothetical protein CMM87_06415 [Rickettsiales bacterium]|nr:hypothetical protein [Rickettsiales bacterium]|tara:strand:- start:35868 stop:36419 length:552 start_codon:yes stop_codon:yes gene_type:complete
MKKLTKKLSAFSLIEVSIALVIIGLMVGGALKGKQLIRSARLNNTVQQMQHLQSSMTSYFDANQTYPGGDLTNQQQVWIDLANFEGTEKPEAESPKAKVGGRVKLIRDLDGLQGHWLKLADENDKGVLTPAEAKIFLSKNNEYSTDTGRVRVLNDSTNHCLNGNRLDLSQKDRVCIVAVEVVA